MLVWKVEQGININKVNQIRFASMVYINLTCMIMQSLNLKYTLEAIKLDKLKINVKMGSWKC